MANEITINLRMSVENGYLVQRFDPSGFSVTMTGTTADGAVQSIPTTLAGTLLGVTSVTTCGWSYFRNTDATNYVDIGVQVAGAFYPFVKLKAGEACVLRLGTNAPYARANTSAVNLQYFILND